MRQCAVRSQRLRVDVRVGSALTADALTDALAARRTPLLSSSLPRRRCTYGGRVRVRVELGSRHDAPPCFVGRVRDDGSGRGEFIGRIHESRLHRLDRSTYLVLAVVMAAAALFGVVYAFPVNPALWIGAPAGVAFLRLARADRAAGARGFHHEAPRIEAAVRAYVSDAGRPHRPRSGRPSSHGRY